MVVRRSNTSLGEGPPHEAPASTELEEEDLGLGEDGAAPAEEIGRPVQRVEVAEGDPLDGVRAGVPREQVHDAAVVPEHHLRGRRLAADHEQLRFMGWQLPVTDGGAGTSRPVTVGGWWVQGPL